MRLTRRFALGLLVVVCACQRTESPAPAPSPHATLAPTIAATPAPGGSIAPIAPSPEGSPEAAEDADEDDINKPWGPEFEIDADANRYFGYPPADIVFAAWPLNGSPPFTYTWNFGDGSPEEHGETVLHRYTQLGQLHPYVIGKDGNGETYRMEFIITLVTPERYADVKGLDPNSLPPMLSPTPMVTP